VVGCRVVVRVERSLLKESSPGSFAINDMAKQIGYDGAYDLNLGRFEVWLNNESVVWLMRVGME
jgi:hypothetical protein